jgi:hypothetical protein
VLHPENEYISISEKDGWILIEYLLARPIEVIKAHFLSVCGFEIPVQPSRDNLWQDRNSHLSKALSLSYKNPLYIHRGIGPYLYSDKGERCLDLVNNVSHVGHSNTRVVRALRT